jgi:predicted N-acetyltransferase YhbS
MKISIRLETKNDFRNVENMTREAFWDLYRPGCDEHLMVHQIRKSEGYVKELDFIACDDEKIIGNVMYTKAKVINDNNEESEILCLGPLCVLPPYRGKGIGAMLVNHSIKAAKDLGFNAVALFGNPNYYHRFGFENAVKYNIQTSWGANFEDFMVLELYDGALAGINGRYYADSAYETDKNELEAFEKGFPHKEKLFVEEQF